MGMDVYGRKPKNQTGEYFRNNIWFWHPLWDYCLEMYPVATAKCTDGHSNSGDGLNASDSKKLAQLIKKDLENGKAQKYSDRYEEIRKNLPRQICTHCDGTGIANTTSLNLEESFQEPVKIQGIGSLLKEDLKCKMCDGNGDRENWSSHYPFTIENLKEWQQFLDNCGGFNIY